MTPGVARAIRRVPPLFGGVALMLAVVGLVGWCAEVELLTRWFPGGATLKVNTALTIAALAIGVMWRRGALFAAAGAVLPAVALGEWATGVDLGIDQALVADPASAAAGLPPGRMAAATALGLLFLAVARLSPSVRLGQAAAAGAFAIGWVSVLGYAHELGPLADVWLFGSVSLPTAVSLGALAIASLALEPERGFLPVLTADDAGARLLRRLLPGVWLLPGVAAVGARALARGPGWPLGFTAVLAATTTAVAFSALLAWTAARARRAEGVNQELSRRLLALQEEERRSIATELHDEFGQTLAALGLLLGRTDAPAAREEARELVRTLTAGVRGLALELRPSMLDDLGLEPALRWQCERWAEHTERVASLVVTGEVRRLPPAIETAAYRIAQAALTNAALHSGAERVRVAVDFGPFSLTLAVADDGRGFDPSAQRGPSLGLVGMKERARLLGGTYVLETGPSGTTVRVTLPVG